MRSGRSSHRLANFHMRDTRSPRRAARQRVIAYCGYCAVPRTLLRSKAWQSRNMVNFAYLKASSGIKKQKCIEHTIRTLLTTIVQVERNGRDPSKGSFSRWTDSEW
jgi:hypothetical protein